MHVLRTLTINALRRNPVSALVLVLFVALSAMLASSAAALVITSTGASASLMEQARTPHFLQMHAGQLDESRLAEFAASHPHVEDYSATPMLGVDGAAIRITGGATDTNLAAGLQDNGFVTQNAGFDYLLDTEGQVIDPAPGTVWLPLFYRESLGLEAGQTLTVTGPSGSTELEVAGFLRDSQMNSSYASSKRLLVTEADLASLTAIVGDAGSTEYLIEFRLADETAVGEFESDYRAAGLEANGPAITWSLFVLVNSLSEGITAAIVILVTVLLVGIALLCVRFTLLTTLDNDFRELGVLKAIGVRNRDLKTLYSRRYLALAFAGALLGLLASIALSQVLLRNVTLYMGPADRTLPSLLAGVALSALIVGIVALAVRRTLRRVERVSPVQAIRTGAPADATRSRPARVLSVVRSGVNARLGLRDVLGRKRLYVVPLVIYTLASFILVVPQNLHTTVTAPNFITYMGAGVSDMRVDVQPADPQRVAALDRELTSDERIAAHTVLSTASYTALDATGASAVVKIESGDLGAFPLTYLGGAAPTTPGQLALSQLQAETLGASMGDIVAVTPVLADDGTAEPLQLTVTGIYQDVTNGGRTAKMVHAHTSADLMWSTIYADFAPGVDATAVVPEYAAANPDLKVSSVRDYVQATLGGTIDALQSASIVSFIIGLIVATLITALFMTMLMARDRFSIAVMRGLGFRFGHIQWQYVVRSITVLLLGVVLGALLANTLGGVLASAMLSTIGLSQLTLVANPWLAYLATPLALLAVVAIATLLSTRPNDRTAISAALKD